MTLQHQSSAQLPTRFGLFTIHVFREDDGTEQIALVAGEPVNDCLLRIHSECATGDLFGSLRCDCRDQLEASMQKISGQGYGMLIYLRKHEGRGIGLANKIKAYAFQEEGLDTVDANLCLGFSADMREYGAAIEILNYFKLSRVCLLSNNPCKISALEAGNITISERTPLWTKSNTHNEKYLNTKKEKMGHLG
ncbi:MAG TPA: GTP cyclohydrolase II [Rhodospirillaceae bacterium]|nr:GTP cyclohydrolase II [Rhodospirillaceae bacterium]